MTSSKSANSTHHAPIFDAQRARVRHFKFPGRYLWHFMSFPVEENAHLRLRGSVASSMSASSLNQVVGSN
jgi:hypothetical protein